VSIANTIDEVSSDDDDGPVSDEDTDRFVTEILTAAGAVGLAEDEVSRAYDLFTQWVATAAMVELWARREVTLSWDVARQDLVIRHRDGWREGRQ
jgi:hypothetical protein